MASESTTATAQPASKRWSYFHSALQLAIQRSSHKWTYEDFTECFSAWCEEQPENASRIFTTVSRHMEDQITEHCEELLRQFNVRENLDNLHTVVTEARARRQKGYEGKDVWKEDLNPGAAVRARTVPLLEKERDRLRAELGQLENENIKLQSEMQSNVRGREEADAETSRLLDLLDEIYAKWNHIPIEEIQSWTLQTAESVTSSRPV
ncbi:uncharacterized protein FIBRA_08383 [Fibroporia radiculosa]|uniref:Uncharacterized protein n=1 Tax=Fibroporia radiculosa TaxID=599839 RepID=J4GH89_9APHY|nr:uncharacterized protein FIBRA_08383 [Fibroporia radiculosa]CCM06133.1 predicted protein [Fibroporia radiculosa]